MLFTAEYSKRGCYGIGICMANTVEKLIEILDNRGYEFDPYEKEEIVTWSKKSKNNYYAMRLSIRRGKPQMTEYTSF